MAKSIEKSLNFCLYYHFPIVVLTENMSKCRFYHIKFTYAYSFLIWLLIYSHCRRGFSTMIFPPTAFSDVQATK